MCNSCGGGTHVQRGNYLYMGATPPQAAAQPEPEYVELKFKPDIPLPAEIVLSGNEKLWNAGQNVVVQSHTVTVFKFVADFVRLDPQYRGWLVDTESEPKKAK